MKLSDLMLLLQDIADDAGDADPAVVLAIQPSWPFEHSIGQIVTITKFLDGDGREVEIDEDEMSQEEIHEARMTIEEETMTVYIAEAGQIGYLSGEVSRELGWR